MAKKNAAGQMLPLIGAGVGAAFGGPAGAGIGMAAGGALGNLFGDDGSDEVFAELERNRARLDAIEIPELTWRDYTPEALTSENANFELVADDPVTRSMQLSALRRMAGLAETGESEADAAGFDKARALGSQMAKANTQAAIQNAEARGVGGSGLEFAMREAAGQAGAERARSSALEQAANSARQRALYTQAYGQGLGSFRSQDQDTNQANADIINRFNLANTAGRNSAAQMNVTNRNQAQQMNNQGRLDMQQQTFNNQMARATGQNNAGSAIANAHAAQGAANTAQNNMWTQAGMNMAMSAMNKTDDQPVKKQPRVYSSNQYGFADPYSQS